jgi:hypothetical protein
MLLNRFFYVSLNFFFTFTGAEIRPVIPVTEFASNISFSPLLRPKRLQEFLPELQHTAL